MADLRIDRGAFYAPIDYGETEQQLGLREESTSLPEWQGWDRIENSAQIEGPFVPGLDLSTDLSPVLDQLRSEPEYQGLTDLDEKRLLLDILDRVSGKLDDLIESSPSQKLENLRETLNELLDLSQTAYVHQLSNVKG